MQVRIKPNKFRVSEIRVKQIRVNQGVGIFNSPYDLSLNNEHRANRKE